MNLEIFINMKLKDFLEQFKNLDPEMEVYRWWDHGIKKLDDKDSIDDTQLRYIKNDNSEYTEYFRTTKNSDYDKLILVIP